MKTLAVGCSLLAVVLCVGCASAPPPSPLPQWTQVPSGVLDVFCARLREEGISPEQPIEVVTMTQPLITPQTIAALGDAAFYSKKFDVFAASEEANREAAPIPVAVPRGPCAWHPVEETRHRSTDVMSLEMSSPLRNPFVRNTAGIFVRMSLAGEGATWYWLPVAEREGRLAVGRLMPLGLR